MKHLAHPQSTVLPLLLSIIAFLPWAAAGGTVLSDNFATSSLNSATPTAPTSSSTAYHLFSSKPWNPTPTIAANDLKFGIGATTSGHIEAHALFTATPIALTNIGDYLELTVTFQNTSGLFAQGGHVGFGLYNSGGVAPLAGGMNATAVSGTTGVTGGAQGWQGYVARLAYNAGTHRLATRPAQSITTGNNQDLITEGSGSQSYANAVSLASATSTFTQSAGAQLTETLRYTLTAVGTLQIESRLYAGADTNGTLLVSQSATATGANFLTNSFDALALGWRATANTAATLMDIQSLTITTSLPVGGPSDTVAGIYFQQQPTDANVGIALAPAVTVVATNASGVPVTNAPITLSLASGSGSLNGTLSQVTGNNGTATFANLSLSAAGAKQLQATAGPITATSATFNIIGIPVVATAFAPTNSATGLCVDTLLRITFDKPVTLQKTGTIRIYNTAAPAIPVDTIDLSQNVDNHATHAANVQPRTIGGDTFTNFPVMISGSTATIFPHAGVLTTNKTYYVLMDSGIFTDSNGNVFPGISATNIWQFSTKATGPANSTNLIVAADGSGDFCTVQGAVDYVPSGNTTPRLINIRNGTYPEIVNVKAKHNLLFRGETRSGARLAYPNNNWVYANSHFCMIFKVNANDIALDNLTVTNTTPQGGSQAFALMVESGNKRFVCNNSEISSFQDTILVNTSDNTAYFRDSLIQGDVDYIWGGGNCFFTNCEMRTLRATGGYVTQARTTANSNGMSFVKCAFTVPSAGYVNCLFGRALTIPNGNVALINCRIDTNAYPGWNASDVANASLNLRWWEFGNSNLNATAAVAFNGTPIGVTNNDPRLIAAQDAVLWLNGWTPQLAPNILSQPTNQTLNAGQPAEFSVSATGIPEPTYQWRKNGGNIPGATNASYSIAAALPTDSGTYAVLVTTPASSVLSSNAVLTVNTPIATAFPGAEGAGAYATGGRGGDVYYVTTLADSGAGSLRNGISTAPAGGRTILFKVSGNIQLATKLSVNKSNLTIAGQTAPGDGICLQDESFDIGANNLIVRHLRTRLGTNNLVEADSMWIASGTNVIIDHLSASWSVDETLSATRGTANLTVQNCFITESLRNSIHVKGAHGYGGIISSSNTTTYTYHHNLYAHHSSRNPRTGCDNPAAVLRIDFRNNVIYDWGFFAGYSGATNENNELNYVNNYLVAGPSSTQTAAFVGNGNNIQIYQSGNFIDNNKNGQLDGVDTGWGMFAGTYVPLNNPLAAPAVTTESAAVACQRVLAQSGAMPWRRDAVDQRIAATFRHQNGSTVDFVAGNSFAGDYITNSINGTNYIGINPWPVLASTTAPTDTDNDGMPDYWELANGSNSNLATDRNTTNVLTGYTKLEEYLNWLADAHALCSRNGFVDVNLRTATGGATNLTYTVAAGRNGTVSLLGDGYTARFIAAANTNGGANFTFTATDPATATSFGPVNYGVLITTTNAPVSNTAPTLAAITNRTIIAGTTINFTNSASDADLPAQPLTFSLPNGPSGSSVNFSTGSFTWRPSIAQSNTTNTMSVIVTDNGVPSLSATQSFTIIVLRPVQPNLQTVALAGGALQFQITGDVGPDYLIQASTNLVDWSAVTNLASPVLPFTWTDPVAANFPQRFYRVFLGP
ncbi:MAG: pectinesterase family protein [Verrucomicrobiota bacterium]